MKSRKVLHHNKLIEEVIQQASSRFQPNISIIKRCIEYLIEKEYINRIEGESDKYQYIV